MPSQDATPFQDLQPPASALATLAFARAFRRRSSAFAPQSRLSVQTIGGTGHAAESLAQSLMVRAQCSLRRERSDWLSAFLSRHRSVLWFLETPSLCYLHRLRGASGAMGAEAAFEAGGLSNRQPLKVGFGARQQVVAPVGHAPSPFFVSPPEPALMRNRRAHRQTIDQPISDTPLERQAFRRQAPLLPDTLNATCALPAVLHLHRTMARSVGVATAQTPMRSAFPERAAERVARRVAFPTRQSVRLPSEQERAELPMALSYPPVPLVSWLGRATPAPDPAGWESAPGFARPIFSPAGSHRLVLPLRVVDPVSQPVFERPAQTAFAALPRPAAFSAARVVAEAVSALAQSRSAATQPLQSTVGKRSRSSAAGVRSAPSVPPGQADPTSDSGDAHPAAVRRSSLRAALSALELAHRLFSPAIGARFVRVDRQPSRSEATAPAFAREFPASGPALPRLRLKPAAGTGADDTGFDGPPRLSGGWQISVRSSNALAFVGDLALPRARRVDSLQATPDTQAPQPPTSSPAVVSAPALWSHDNAASLFARLRGEPSRPARRPSGATAPERPLFASAPVTRTGDRRLDPSAVSRPAFAAPDRTLPRRHRAAMGTEAIRTEGGAPGLLPLEQRVSRRQQPISVAIGPRPEGQATDGLLETARVGAALPPAAGPARPTSLLSLPQTAMLSEAVSAGERAFSSLPMSAPRRRSAFLETQAFVRGLVLPRARRSEPSQTTDDAAAMPDRRPPLWSMDNVAALLTRLAGAKAAAGQDARGAAPAVTVPAGHAGRNGPGVRAIPFAEPALAQVRRIMAARAFQPAAWAASSSVSLPSRLAALPNVPASSGQTAPAQPLSMSGPRTFSPARKAAPWEDTRLGRLPFAQAVPKRGVFGEQGKGESDSLSSVSPAAAAPMLFPPTALRFLTVSQRRQAKGGQTETGTEDPETDVFAAPLSLPTDAASWQSAFGTSLAGTPSVPGFLERRLPARGTRPATRLGAVAESPGVAWPAVTAAGDWGRRTGAEGDRSQPARLRPRLSRVAEEGRIDDGVFSEAVGEVAARTLQSQLLLPLREFLLAALSRVFAPLETLGTAQPAEYAFPESGTPARPFSSSDLSWPARSGGRGRQPDSGESPLPEVPALPFLGSPSVVTGTAPGPAPGPGETIADVRTASPLARRPMPPISENAALPWNRTGTLRHAEGGAERQEHGPLPTQPLEALLARSSRLSPLLLTRDLRPQASGIDDHDPSATDRPWTRTSAALPRRSEAGMGGGRARAFSPAERPPGGLSAQVPAMPLPGRQAAGDRHAAGMMQDPLIIQRAVSGAVAATSQPGPSESGPAAGASAAGGADVDELAKEVWTRLRRRLAHEAARAGRG